MTHLVVKEVIPEFVGELSDFPFHAIDDRVVKELRAAWTQYPVLRFRNVPIGDAEQVAFTRALGPVSYPVKQSRGKHEKFPEILVISNKGSGDLGDGEVTWHTDMWYIERPPSAAILRAVELPAAGGNTYFSNMYAAFTSLPDALKKRLRGLSIHHQSVLDTYDTVRLGKESPSSSDFASWPGVDHPIVRRHADSGKPCLYLGSVRAYQSIPGMKQQEAKELLDELWQRATDRADVWYQEWKPGDMLLWDNRCLMHRRDAFDRGSIRLMHRTTVEGERPLAAL
ncbi:TauD/TfdA family dioxygenase [Bradyrhizobium sp. WSM1743]|uniref:TauD/TfdA dioxygenase family protein n=1 Tax=Bradyrhizobium sp. WSM1743 TaxID=318996 RepID=UPI0006848C4E|nr:TauD/TfdA family dioxygenase [Bradyrhizobium sp. WSM1743]